MHLHFLFPIWPGRHEFIKKTVSHDKPPKLGLLHGCLFLSKLLVYQDFHIDIRCFEHGIYHVGADFINGQGGQMKILRIILDSRFSVHQRCRYKFSRQLKLASTWDGRRLEKGFDGPRSKRISCHGVQLQHRQRKEAKEAIKKEIKKYVKYHRTIGQTFRIETDVPSQK